MNVKDTMALIDEISLRIADLLKELGDRMSGMEKEDMIQGNYKIEEYVLIMTRFLTLLDILEKAQKQANFSEVLKGFIQFTQHIAKLNKVQPAEVFELLRKKYKIEEYQDNII